MTVEMARAMADRLHAHARDCRRPIDGCAACQKNIAWFAALPPQMLSDVLSERNERSA